MEEIVEKAIIDRQGRVVIPVRARRVAGIKGEVRVVARKGEVMIVPYNQQSLSIEEWYKHMLRVKITLKSRPDENVGKWMSDEYARRKLGL